MHWTRSSWSDSCGVTRVQILHAVATLPRCSGFSRCFANKGLPSGRRNRLCLLKDNSPRILDDTGIALSSYLSLAANQHQSVFRSMTWNEGVAVSEAGIEEALTQIHYNGITNFSANHWCSAMMSHSSVGPRHYRLRSAPGSQTQSWARSVTRHRTSIFSSLSTTPGKGHD